MTMHSHEGYENMNTQPQQPLSIDFTNPGTVEHVVHELKDNLQRLYEQRLSLEDKFNHDKAAWEAVHNDLTHRISIIEAGLERYNSSFPQPEVPQQTRVMGDTAKSYR